MDATRIGVVGDYQDGNETHLAIGAAVDHAAERPGLRAETTWIATSELEGAAERVFGDFDGLWIAPGSPYRSMRGALEAIAHARTSGMPLLGTCGGFQHLIIEFARNVAGIPDAAHAEDDPSASRLLIDKLACSLVGQTMDVTLIEATLAQRAYGTTSATERYYCQFGLNPEYRGTLSDHGLAVSGTDQDGEVRVVELPGHPFFVGTLFVPQTSSARARRIRSSAPIWKRPASGSEWEVDGSPRFARSGRDPARSIAPLSRLASATPVFGSRNGGGARNREDGKR